MAASNKIQVGYIEAQDGAQFQVDAGTAAAPGLVFDDSAATGLYSPGTGQLAFSTSSKQTALRILADGKVGVDCSPTVAFEVNGTIKASAIDAPIEGTLDDWIVHAGDSNTKFGFPANDTFTVECAGLERLRVDLRGNMGLGANSIDNAASGNDTVFAIRGKGSSYSGRIEFQDSSGNKDAGIHVDNGILDLHSDPDNATSNSLIRMHIDNGEVLRITKDGEFGFNSGNVIRENLHAHKADSNQNYLRFTNTTTGNGTTDGFNIGLNGDEEVLLWNFENKPTIFATNNTERLLISNEGKVLIGNSATYSPNGLLHIVGDDNSNGPELYLQVNNNNTTDNIGAIWFGNNVDKSIVKLAGHTHSANNTGDFTVSTSSGGTLGERLRITSGGDILLGTDHATIGANTADGSDNRVWSLCGGSDASQSRGAVITLYGNEAPINSNYGTLSLKSGNTTSSFIDFWTQGAKKVEITKDGVFRIQSTYNGSTTTSNAWPALNITNLQGTYTANNILGGVTFGKAAGHTNGIRAGILAIYQGNGSQAGNVGAHLSFRTSSNGAGDSTEKLFITDNGVICTGNYRGLLDQTLGAVQINGGNQGGRLSFRGTGGANSGLGEMHGWWDSNKVASILFMSGSAASAKDNGQIKMYARKTGGSSDCRLLVKDDGCEFFGNSNIFYGGQSNENLNGDVTIRSRGSAVYQNLRFMSSDGTNSSSIVGYYGGSIMFFNSSTYVWSINNQGERLELTNTALSPRATSTVLDLGTDSKEYRRAYVENAYPRIVVSSITGTSFSSASWYDTGFRRDYMGGLETNGTYIINAFADLHTAGGGNYSCTFTWILGIKDQSTNQGAANDVPLLSVTGHSTNGQLLSLRTVRQYASQGGSEWIQWKPAANLTAIDNSSSGRILRITAQRIGRVYA